MIQIERRGSIAILRLAHGKANAMDVEFCTAIAGRVAECEGDPSVGAVLVTGQAQIFSAGVDLLRVVEGGASYVREFLPALGTSLHAVFACAKPVVAAVNGHAIAGGCILACAADYRVMARGSGRIGIPELIVGVPFPVVPIEIMRFVAPANRLQQWIYGGVTFDADAAVTTGLVDAAVDADRLEADALAAAERMAKLPAHAFALTKQRLREPALERMRATVDAEARAAWESPETLDGVRRYVERTLKKK
jgi:enoyl-CoA hydratase/carnithine racemase